MRVRQYVTACLLSTEENAALVGLALRRGPLSVSLGYGGFRLGCAPLVRSRLRRWRRGWRDRSLPLRARRRVSGLCHGGGSFVSVESIE